MRNSWVDILHLAWLLVTAIAFVGPLFIAVLLRTMFPSVSFLKFIGIYFAAVAIEILFAAVRALLIPPHDSTTTYEALGLVGRLVEAGAAAWVIYHLAIMGMNGKHKTDS